MVYILMFLVYLSLLLKFRRNLLLVILLGLQLLSLGSLMIIGSKDFLSLESFVWVPYVLLLTIMIILPWRNYNNITEITVKNEYRLDFITKIILMLSAYTFIVLAVVAFIALFFISDINEHKYLDGTSDFYVTMLPFNIRFYYLARMFYVFSFLLIPLHFYYQTKSKFILSNLCLLFSTNIILYGLAFFSRWTTLLYCLIFLCNWVIFRNVVPSKVRKKEKKIIYIIGGMLVVFFISVTISRFGSEDKMAIRYESKIPSDSRIQNPVLYSIFDYLGQSNYNGLTLLNQYDGRTFGGEVLFGGVLDFFHNINLIDNSNKGKTMSNLWSGEFAGNFKSYAAYTIYDIGIIGAFLLGLLYYKIVKVKNRNININKLILSSAFLQIPLSSIFYSQWNLALYCVFLYIPLIIFINTKS